MLRHKDVDSRYDLTMNEPNNQPLTSLACRIGVVLTVLGGCAATSHAQAPPFFAAGATSFTPEISVVNSGIVSDVQATVSADQKYVTLNMRQQQSTLIAIQEFTFQNGGMPNNLGNVGGATPTEAEIAAARPDPKRRGVPTTTPVPTPPDPSDEDSAPPAGASILDRPGMTRVDVPTSEAAATRPGSP
jgi:hypothetical protein